MAKSKKKAEKQEQVEELKTPEPKPAKVYPTLKAAAPEAVVTKPWGCYAVLDQGPGWKTKKIQVNPEHRFSLQSHKQREEIWVIVSGIGELETGLNGKKRHMIPGEIAIIFTGLEHRMKCLSETPLVFIETQRGDYLGEDDIRRLHDDYGRK